MSYPQGHGFLYTLWEHYQGRSLALWQKGTIPDVGFLSLRLSLQLQISLGCYVS